MNGTGPDRIREAIRRDRGGDAPSQQVVVCGHPDPNAMRADDPRWKARRPEPRRTVAVRILESIICPGCLGLRFGAAHLARRLAGIDCSA